ncbi:hypothetical protein A9Q76_10070 [Arcobacter sp. 31_11_sub10_T18]|nr:hypothetical protein A9Q76_10070 [Arcobacter sp. 31_11_sub10_T18]
MFTLEVKKVLIACGIISIVLISTVFVQAKSLTDLKRNVDGAVIYPHKDGKYTSYLLNEQSTNGFNQHGRAPTVNEIKAWNIDVMPDGTGLPEGEGSVEDGDELYSAQCAMCHGEFGTGGKGYPTLSGGQGSLKNQLLKEGDEPPFRTIGSYWPYASTLYWYIQSAMPFANPKSLSNNETYALVAYLLSINDIEIDGVELEDEYVLNKEKFLKIKMPNVDGFYPVDPSRSDLKEVRPPLAQGNRCMSDCDAPKAVHIAAEITGFDPAISTSKKLVIKESETTITQGEKIYNESCMACHANEALGAPVLGDKDIWREITSKGIDVVYLNGINGINSMPPKGGNMDLSEVQMKEVIDYMVLKSK